MNLLWKLVWLGAVPVALVCPTITWSQRATSHVRIEGIAYDSLVMRPLAGAVVSVFGVKLSVTSDDRGRFRIDSVPVGMQTFQLQHPAFDSIGLTGSSKSILVQPRGARVVLALPSFERLWRATCGDARVAPENGLVYGVIRDAATEEAIGKVEIDVSWVELVGGGTSLADVTQRRWHRRIRTDSGGEYVACGVPLATPLSVSATRDSVEVLSIELPASQARVRRRDLLINRIVDGGDLARRYGERSAVARTDTLNRGSTDPPSANVAGTLTGVIVNEAGAPIPNVSVFADSVTQVLTDENGRFVLSPLSGGTRRVLIRAIGRVPFDSLINIRTGDTTSLLISLSPVAVLRTVDVRATVVSSRVRAYEDRKRGGFGAYRDSSEIIRYPSIAAVLNTIPNASMRGGLSSLVFNMGTNTQCAASRDQVDFRLDGMPIPVAAMATLDTRSIAAVEVYSRATKMPSELASSIRFRCAVLFWTKHGFGK